MTIKELHDILLNGNGSFEYGTIKRIAELSDCSPSHVRNVLRERKVNIAPLTRIKILEKAAEVALQVKSIQ